eukprot:scaffold230408_cov32-Tisochrysis_lutea.AAC.2
MSGGRWGPRAPLTPHSIAPSRTPSWVLGGGWARTTFNQLQPLPLPSGRSWARITLTQTPSGRGSLIALPARSRWAYPRVDPSPSLVARQTEASSL